MKNPQVNSFHCCVVLFVCSFLFSQCNQTKSTVLAQNQNQTLEKTHSVQQDTIKDFSRAESQYSQFCASCHGQEMTAFVDRRWQYGTKKNDIVRSIEMGIEEAGMPSYREAFTAVEIETLADYILEGIADRKSYDVKENKAPKYYQTENYNLEVETIVEDISIPWGMKVQKDGTMFFTERKGDVKIRKPNGEIISLKGIPEVKYGRQGGMMDIILHPDFESNKLLYLSYSKPQGSNSSTVVVRGRLDGDELKDVKEIWQAIPFVNTQYHYGSRMVFDKEGYLFVTVGDRGKRDEHPQFLTNSCGKVHRIHDDGRIPDDNPFYSVPDAVKSIWTYGHRNQQGMVYNESSGQIWTHEHGPRGGDELNLIQAGNNYGWPVVSKGLNYNGTTFTDITEKEGMLDAVRTWIPSIAPSGMAIVRGNQYPAWDGDILTGSLRFNYVSRISIANGEVEEEERILKDIGRVRAIEMGDDGFLYVGVEEPGRILRVSVTDTEKVETMVINCATTVTEEALIGCWTHSHEEDDNSTKKIFRPCDYKTFPISRFRHHIELKSDGQCEYLYLEPTDRHSMRKGTWKLSQDCNLFIFDEDDKKHMQWKIGTLEKDRIEFIR